MHHSDLSETAKEVTVTTQFGPMLLLLLLELLPEISGCDSGSSIAAAIATISSHKTGVAAAIITVTIAVIAVAWAVTLYHKSHKTFPMIVKVQHNAIMEKCVNSLENIIAKFAFSRRRQTKPTGMNIKTWKEKSTKKTNKQEKLMLTVHRIDEMKSKVKPDNICSSNIKRHN
ncbi:Hypothetical predicted protein [Octopus vulgaris]|uniref:Uncharacterized protein n=1 Tax=Octopus vulgaris TaxID=6645 RepID=A0AA36FD95_OCTVU|nr:Hypothetical predicted protein [Octopus vulgaris]